jgi:hypothetical protein
MWTNRKLGTLLTLCLIVSAPLSAQDESPFGDLLEFDASSRELYQKLPYNSAPSSTGEPTFLVA